MSHTHMKNNIKTNYQKLIKLFPKKRFNINFYTEDCETITMICTETNEIEYFKYVTASCGCCSDIKNYKENADYIINYLSDYDFQELFKELKK